ncbi:MAG: hypothetical protein IJV09_07710 [Prevotella sp.]|nr:hypothetical protein [Prevotella sp.]
MELLLERTEKNSKFTVGRLSILTRTFDEYLGREEKEFLCDTLEPKSIKETTGKRLIRRKTAITSGRYPVVITYSERYQRWLPLLIGVPKFKDARIIIGKTVDDIDTGLIVGQYHGDGRMVGSPYLMRVLKQRIVEAKERGEGVYIQIRNEK